MQIIMTIFALIDWMVYGLVSEMFSLIFLIAEVDIFKDGALDALSNRVYGVLGVIILFKIVISAIQYLISPDKLSDKDKGMGGLLTRTIISIALLALVPTIFTFAKDAQVIVSKAIPAIIIGREVGTDDTEDIKEAGNWMAFTTLSTFIQVKDDKKLDNDEGINDMDSFLSNITAGCGFFAPSECKYTYQFVFSIPIGIFMLYILLSMGIDIAIRSIKLGILQLLAPIPIASYINNQENFKSWYTTCFKVYADLFIRLILIYFIVFVMGIIASGNVSLGNNAFVVIYMIIAILLFAKSAPKFISDALGLKGDGMGGIADMFKPAWSRAHAPAAALVNPVRNAFDNFMYARANGRGVADSLRRAAGGLAAGTRDALTAIGQGKSAADLKQMREASKLKSQHRVNRAFQRDARELEHNSLGARLTEMLRGRDAARTQELRNDAERKYNNELNSKRSLLSAKMEEFKNTSDAAKAAQLSKEISSLQSDISSLEKGKQTYIARDIIANKYKDETVDKQNRIMNLERAISLNRFKTPEEKMKAVNELNELRVEVADRAANSASNIKALQEEYTKSYGTYSDPDWNAGFTFKDTVRAKFNEEIGVAGLTGAAYTQVADILKSNRSGLWSGEAMTKLTQNPNILEISGGQTVFESKIVVNPDGSPKKISYSEIRDLNMRVQSGNITEAEIRAAGYSSGAEIQAAYTDIEKSAATEYINLAMNGKLKGGNSTVTETLKRMRVELANSAISKREKDAILEEFDKNPGKFLATASDRQERLRTKGADISSYNSGKKEG